MKLRHSVFAAMASLMTFAACETQTDPVKPDNFPEVYTVKLNCGGELDVTQEPLSRFTPDNNDLYGIQVYYAPISGGNYKHYAYGLFDDVSDVEIELLSDYKYQFRIDMVDDGKNLIYSDSLLIDTQNYVGYGEPFKAYNGYNASSDLSITKVSNEFTISETHKFDDCLGSEIRLKNGSLVYNPKDMDVYYGLVMDYIPESDGESVSVLMKRMVAGLKVVAGDFLNEGYLEVGNNLGYMDRRDDFVLTPEDKVVERTYVHHKRYDWYLSELTGGTGQPQRHVMWFNWHKNDTTVLKLKSQSIDLYRLKQTIVTVEFKEDTVTGQGTLSMLYDDEPIVPGSSYVIGDTQDEYAW